MKRRASQSRSKPGPRTSAAAVAARLERNGDRTDDPWPPEHGSPVGYVEISRYGRTVRVDLTQVRELVKQQRGWCGGERLELMGLASACRAALNRMGRIITHA